MTICIYMYVYTLQLCVIEILTFLDPNKTKYRVIQKDVLIWTVNGTSTHVRQLVAVFQVLCSLYGLTCVGYAQNSHEFVSSSPLIHVVGRSFCLYTDSLFAQIGDSNNKCSSSLELNVETKTKHTVHCSCRLSFNELKNAKNLCCIVVILFLTDAAARMCDSRVL